jgi:hypothetical protein
MEQILSYGAIVTQMPTGKGRSHEPRRRDNLPKVRLSTHGPD